MSQRADLRRACATRRRRHCPGQPAPTQLPLVQRWALTAARSAGRLRRHDRRTGAAGGPQYRHSAVRRRRLCRLAPGRLAAAIRGSFTVFSFQREVLETVVPQLRFEKAARPAQVRLKVGDMSNARITPVAQRPRLRPNAGNFAGQSAAAARLEPAASRAAGRVPRDGRMALGREADLPLGREVRFAGNRRRAAALDLDRPATRLQPGGLLKIHAPKGYLSPPLNWFRGLDLDATMTEKTVSAHAEVIMQSPPKK